MGPKSPVINYKWSFFRGPCKSPKNHRFHRCQMSPPKISEVMGSGNQKTPLKIHMSPKKKNYFNRKIHLPTIDFQGTCQMFSGGVSFSEHKSMREKPILSMAIISISLDQTQRTQGCFDFSVRKWLVPPHSVPFSKTKWLTFFRVSDLFEMPSIILTNLTDPS